MGKPIDITNPFETGGESILTQDMSTRQFLGMGVKALLALGATKASDVLGQTLPSTYDEIIAALNKGELTYEQLIEIGKKYNGNFNDDQRKVLSGELTKLRLQKEKPVVKATKPPLNETKEQKDLRLANEKALKMSASSAKTLRENFLQSKNWKLEPGNTLKIKVKPGKGVKMEGEKDLELTHNAKVSLNTVLAPGVYDITATMNADANPISLYIGSNQGAISMSGEPIPAGKTKCVANIENGKKQRITIPKNCVSAMFQGILTPGNNTLHIEDIAVETVAEDLKFAQQ